MGVSLWAFRWRSCPQGRRTSVYVRNTPTLALARGTPKNKTSIIVRPTITHFLKKLLDIVTLLAYAHLFHLDKFVALRNLVHYIRLCKSSRSCGF
ncbi:MAG: hypothetical protein RML38_00490 [Bacteroidia bacterium]|nr:hypothetical protein [Bacteroidia bacterium]